MVHSARQVEKAGVGLFAIVPTGLVLRSFAEKADYVILIQENT